MGKPRSITGHHGSMLSSTGTPLRRRCDRHHRLLQHSKADSHPFDWFPVALPFYIDELTFRAWSFGLPHVDLHP